MFHVFAAPMTIPSIGVCCSILRQESGREPGGRAVVSFGPRSEACSSELSTSPQRRGERGGSADRPTGGEGAGTTPGARLPWAGIAMVYLQGRNEPVAFRRKAADRRR